MIKLNEYWYSHQEVKEALEKKGYIVITAEASDHPRDFPRYQTYAFKKGEEPNVLNTLESVAIKEFHKKPPLN
ncbi:MAG: hypothetical protein KBA33_09905 [Cloacibacterium sp.]|nr:hypothetical protein [Cloacibacterium sp.]